MAIQTEHGTEDTAVHTALEAHTTESAAHGGTEEGLLASVGLNGQLFVFQLVNFLLVMATVWYLMLKPLTKKMEERRRIIDDSLDKAKEIETNLHMSEQKFQERIDDAKVLANKIMEDAHAEAESMKEQFKKKAKDEIALLVQQSKKNIEIDKEEMRAELKKETAELVVTIVEKMLKEKLDSKKDAGLIEELLKNVK
ncbi:MAG TPA: F0F1 ATP synthase subunit B [Candidatus Kapabacteria bacterium]|nr:F0F1 ATP synthase subunit B [Candidatus Kapabacteria bacterium]